MMGLGEPDLVGSALSLGSCSICLEAVTDDADRSIVKLQCGHRFHLDCIGSAFNAKGAMQCPNCRRIEKGQWLYGSAGCQFPDDDYSDDYDEDLYDLAEMSSFGTQVSSTFDQGEFLTNLVGQHALPAESTNPCPSYASHPGPGNYSSSSTSSGYLDGSSSYYYNNWNGASVHSDMLSYARPSSSINQRAAGGGPSSDMTRSATFMNPFPVASSSITSSMVPSPPHPGSVQAYFQQPNNSHSPTVVSSSSGHRSISQAGRADQNDGFYYLPSAGGNFQDADNPMLNHSRPHQRRRLNSFQADTDSNWGSFHQDAAAVRSTSFVLRHRSYMMPFRYQHHHHRS